MEFLLQWLDELDDLVAAVLLSWERLRPYCLLAGSLAAVLLHSDAIGFDAGLPALLLVNVAAASVLIWLILSALDFRLHRRLSRSA